MFFIVFKMIFLLLGNFSGLVVGEEFFLVFLVIFMIVGFLMLVVFIFFVN